MSSGRAETMAAVQEHLKHVVVPVLYDYEVEGLDQLGTATLFAVGDETVLVSALHTFEELKAERIIIPENFNSGFKLINIWPFDIVDDKQNDLIALKLNSEAARRARIGWRTVSMAKCKSPHEDACFAISGFPSCRLRRPGPDGLLGGALVTSYLQRLEQMPEGAASPKDSNVDLFFLYRSMGTADDGTEIETPKLHGVSGAAIWELELPNRSDARLWTPEGALSFVGVQTDARHFEYARGKQWSVVAPLVESASIA